MSIEIAWSDGHKISPGMDQLGIRGNSVRMYDHLVPGITNVTNRVRYYSMHAWFIWWWAKNIATDDIKEFRRKLRIFECIVGMAEKLRDYDCNENFLAIVGSDTFSAWLRDQKGLKTNTIVPLVELSGRYWKHGGGGFGQYYSVSAQRLGVINEMGKLFGLTEEIGVPLAEVFQAATISTNLEKILDKETATIGDLRSLVKASTFQEIPEKEETILRKVLFDKKENRLRDTLLMILALARGTPGGIQEDPLWQVLESALHGRTSKNTKFAIPDLLTEHIAFWRIYALHEYLAVSLETLLSVAINIIGQKEFDEGYSSTWEVAVSVANKLPAKLQNKIWGDFINETIAESRLPSLDPKADSFDERTLRDAAIKNVKTDEAQALTSALSLLARIAGRIENINPYEIFNRENMSLMPGRISLLSWSLFSKERTESTCQEFLTNVVSWVLRAHMRLAAAKLIVTNVYTYKVAFADGYLTMVNRMEPTLSLPRLLQATRMLTDLGLLSWKGNSIVISNEGKRVLIKYNC